MRLTTFGLFTASFALFALGCADTAGERPTVMAAPGGMGGTGMGGTSGGSAPGGSGGTAGDGGGGAGGSPSGGSSGAGGSAPSTPAACSGCVELIVPVTAGGQQAQYVIRPAAAADLSDATVIWRVRLITPASEIPGDQIFVTTFAQNGAPDYAGIFRPQVVLSAANGFDPNDDTAWQPVTLDLANTAPLGEEGGGDAGAGGPELLPNDGFDKSAVFQHGIQVGVLGSFTGSGTVHVAIDSVTYTGTGGLPNAEFTAGADGLTFDPFQPPPGVGAESLVPRPGN